jgi:hypothetical protein
MVMHNRAFNSKSDLNRIELDARIAASNHTPVISRAQNFSSVCRDEYAATYGMKKPSVIPILVGALILSALIILAAPRRAVATEVVSVSNEFMISRDYSRIVIRPPDARSARVFIDPIRNVSPSENAELRGILINLLSDKLQLVSDKANANYFLQIVFERHKNYSIRNPKRDPAHGFILMGLCKYPIEDMPRDCESLTYFYFDNYKKTDVFTKVFHMWVDAVIPSN